MKITVSKKELYDKLKIVGKVVGTHKTVPILENFMFVIENEQLTITGSDGATTIKSIVELVSCDPVEIKFAVDKTLFTGLSELSEQPIELVIDQNLSIRVNYANGHFSIQGKDVDVFPVVTVPEECQVISIERNILVEGIKTVLPFIGNDELRPVFNGVYIDSKDGKLSFVSTDSHLLALREYKTDSETFETFSAIVPGKAAKIILQIISDYHEERVIINTSFKRLSVKTDRHEITTLLLEGKYPNYRGVIPQGFVTTANVITNDIATMIRRLSVFSNQASRLIRLNVSNNEIKVDAQDVDYAISAEEIIQADIQGEPVVVGFNAQRFLDIMQAVNTEYCDIKLIDASRAGIITPQGIEGITLLIMPLLITNN